MIGVHISSKKSRRIWLFGALRIADAEQSISIPSGNAQNLFTFLALSPGYHTRERLADLLWPEASPERIRRYISNLIYRLRQILGDDWLIVQDEHIALRTGSDLWVDAWEFESLLALTDPEATRQAVILYRGDLLPENYADWLLPHRVALREKYLAALRQLANVAEDGQRLNEAFDYYFRIATEDPLNEAARRGLMRIYAQMDRHAAALGEFEQLSALLAEELGVEPISETVALAESIRLDYETIRIAKAPALAFIGRRWERAALLREADKAQNGQGGLVLVEGEVGVGKTRLLEMVAEGAAWRGMAVAWGKATEFGVATPYAPFDEAFQNALTGPRAARLRKQLSPITLAILSAFAPGLQVGMLPEQPVITSMPNSPNLPAAVHDGLTHLGEISPLLIILDDVQWAGPAFWDLLTFIPRLGRSAVLLVLVYRPESLRANAAAWKMLQKLDLELAPLRLQLAGLDLTACEDLAHELGHPLSPRQLEELYTTTDGNPLYIQEVLAAPPGNFDLPPSLTLLLQDRLASLSPEGRNALELAAVLGREFTHGVWQSIGGMGVIAAIPDLLDARFIEETERGYQFQHDLTRQHVYQGIAPEQLIQLHRQAAEALLRQHATPEILAWHYERGALWQEAIHYHRQAGERALQAYAYQVALKHDNRGIDLLANLPDASAEFLALLLQRQRVLRLLARLEEWRADVDEIERLAVELDNPSALLEALEARIRLTYIASEMAALRAVIQRALSLAPDAGEPALEARILNTAGFYLSDSLGEHAEAIPHLYRAIELSQTAHETSLYIESLCNLAFAQWATGSCRAAYESAARALATAELHRGHFPARAHALASLGQVAMGLTHWEQARESLQKAIGLYDELSDAWNLGDSLYNFAITTSAMGQHDEAIQAAERLLHLAQQAGISPASDLGIWYHALLLRVYTEAGDFIAAERIIGTIERGINKMESGRGPITALTALGSYYLALNHLRDATDLLVKAVNLWKPTKNYGDVLCALLHAIATYRLEDFPAAHESLGLATEVLAKSDAAYHLVLYEYTCFIVLGRVESLEAAHTEIYRQAAAMENSVLRQAFLSEVRLHREIETQWVATPEKSSLYSQESESQIILLARQDAPLGKSLTDAEKVAVRWTVDAGEPDTVILRQNGKVVLRQQRILRLLNEAETQGAAPTDNDLAQALGVNRRTILRDMAVLKASGEVLPTRRRKK